MRLNPALRENHRYILMKAVTDDYSENLFDSKEIFIAISDSMRSLSGDALTAVAWPSVLFQKEDYVIVRCARGTEKRTLAALSAITKISGRNVAIHTIKESGTIITLKKEIERLLSKTAELRMVNVVINGSSFSGKMDKMGRIDLKEKGINHEIPRYITENDIEAINYDE